jgi:acetate---CoA ligase (ADP-forming)
MNSSDPSLAPFFSPTGVAILGASLDPNKLGYGLSRNLVQSGYRGAIHFVNLKGGILMGHPVYRRLAEVPDPVDLAVILIPAQTVPQAILECAERGIRNAIVASGGFRETGAAGKELEILCLQIARQHEIRLLGPNCIGLLDTHLPIDTTFLSPPGPTPGDVAFISHSGAICAAVIDWARGQGFGLSRLVSLGNQVDVTESDMLAPVAADPYTRVLTLYLEGVSDGRRFVEQASRVTRSKPVVALKVGRFESGQRAVASHTGALAGQESAFNAAFRRSGVIRAETTEELFDWARALAWCPLPQGRSVAVLTNSGGPGVTAADAVEAHGLYLAKPSLETSAALRAQLVPEASVQNPVDMLAAATPQQYANCLKILLSDPDVHSVMVILPPPPMHTAGGIAKAIIPVIYTADKPVVVALMGERLIQEAVEHFRAAHVPDYRFPERAAVVLAILTQRAEYIQACAREEGTETAASSSSEPPASLDGVQPETVRSILAKSRPGSAFSQDQAYQLLEAYGIQTLAPELARSAEQAVEIAVRTGFPVALKVASPDISHKSDVGGVLLDLGDEKAVRDGFNQICERAGQAQPGAEISGVYVQKMVGQGQEVIVGTVQDPQFGPLVMFGSGGVEVEGLRDVEFGLAPLTEGEAETMLDRTWAGRKLEGYRHLPPADREAVIKTLIRLARLAADFPKIAELEINPLRVLPAGQGVLAIDVRGRAAASE